MTDKRCKQIMEHLGMPNSKSLMQAIYQVVNETEQEVREKLTPTPTSDNITKCPTCGGDCLVGGDPSSVTRYYVPEQPSYDWEAYFKKACQTCKDNETTNTTWYHNFVLAYEKLLDEYQKLTGAKPTCKDCEYYYECLNDHGVGIKTCKDFELTTDLPSLGILESILEPKHDEFVKAVEHLLNLHMCEQEGIASGMPKPKEWISAVDNVKKEMQKLPGVKQ
jgi:hypothetical protein